jgi:hypothetical protein
MNPIRALLLASLALVVSGCASSYRVVQVPHYGADLYPQSQTRAGITVAVDEMTSAERVARLFGADLVKEGVLPVNVVVSNYGKQRLLLKPSDILLHQGKEVIDPVPVEMVMGLAKRQKTFLRDTTAGEVDKYFNEHTFKETALHPGRPTAGLCSSPCRRRSAGPTASSPRGACTAMADPKSASASRASTAANGFSSRPSR